MFVQVRTFDRLKHIDRYSGDTKVQQDVRPTRDCSTFQVFSIFREIVENTSVCSESWAEILFNSNANRPCFLLSMLLSRYILLCGAKSQLSYKRRGPNICLILGNRSD